MSFKFDTMLKVSGTAGQTILNSRLFRKIRGVDRRKYITQTRTRTQGESENAWGEVSLTSRHRATETGISLFHTNTHLNQEQAVVHFDKRYIDIITTTIAVSEPTAQIVPKECSKRIHALSNGQTFIPRPLSKFTSSIHSILRPTTACLPPFKC